MARLSGHSATARFRLAAADSAGFPSPYQRSQYGGDVGGAIIKNKLFFFADGERTIQQTASPGARLGSFRPVLRYLRRSVPRRQPARTFGLPLTKTRTPSSLDSVLSRTLWAPRSGYGYSLYDNIDITRNQVVGVDFNTGSFSHSIRFSYLKFQNQIVDATTGNSALPFNNIGAEIFTGVQAWWPVLTFWLRKALRKATTR